MTNLPYKESKQISIKLFLQIKNLSKLTNKTLKTVKFSFFKLKIKVLEDDNVQKIRYPHIIICIIFGEIMI